KLDKATRVCTKYLERLIDKKFQLALKVKQPSTPRVDLSKIEVKLDSLQKQIDGLKPKIDASYSFVQERDEREIYLNALTEKAEKIIDDMKEHFEELYKSGYYKEGQKRKIREEGLFKKGGKVMGVEK
ncbi:unnamed protein product, partial [marine sediment metagenome]